MYQGDSISRKRDTTLSRLLHALECARSRLAVAMAAESKATPPERWQNYVAVEDRARRCLRRLRSLRRTMPQEAPPWLPTLELLLQLPAAQDTARLRRGEAQYLCRCLEEALGRIETQEGALREFDNTP